MFAKFKWIIAGTGVVIIFVLAITLQLEHKGKLREKADRIRLQKNQNQLTQEKAELTTLVLKTNEVTGIIKHERDSLAEALRIKPKQIIKYVDRLVFQTETIPKIIPVYKPNDSTYYISDIDTCFTYEGIAIIENDTMTFKRTLFDYHNNIIDAYFWDRKWFLGKKKFYQVAKAQCGGTKTKQIEFIKK